MAEYNTYPGRMSLNNMIFSYIKGYINGILPYDDNRCYSENPFVDVESIARNVGIKDVIYTSFTEDYETIAKKYHIKNIQSFRMELLANEHAFLYEVDGEFLIFVNNLKKIDSQRFSITHEIEHYISKKDAKYLKKNNYISSFSLAQAVAYLYLSSSFNINNQTSPRMDLLPDMDVVKALVEQLPKTDNSTKRKTDYIKQLKKMEKNRQGANDLKTNRYIGSVSKIIAKDLSTLFNKYISEKIPRAILHKQLKQARKKIQVSLLLYNTITEVVEEEIADYFAANLLVPTELLTLWEQKPDSKTARAFGVPVKCIKKRKKYEIEQELDYITSEYLSSYAEIDGSVPSIPDESTQTSGRCEFHDTGRG